MFVFERTYSKKRYEIQELKTKQYFCINPCPTMSHQNHFDYVLLSKPPNVKTQKN